LSNFVCKAALGVVEVGAQARASTGGGLRRWLRGTILAALLGAAAALAQGPLDSALRVRVVTAQGVPAIGVRVWVQQVNAEELPLAASGAAAAGTEVRSGRDGSFVLLRLQPGEYRLRTTTATAGAFAEVAVELEPGAVGDVTVRLGSAGQKDFAARGFSYTSQAIAALPVRGQDWESLAELDSAANDATLSAPDGNGSDDDEDGQRDTTAAAAAGGLSYAGLPPSQNAESVDGLSAQQSFRQGPRGAASQGPSSQSSFGQGAIRSFRLLPATFSAQYGGAAGGVIAVASRSGGERLHGNAFVIARQSAWAAANPFSVETHYNSGAITSELVKPDAAAEQMGVAVGLPLGGSKAARWRRNAALFVSLDARLTHGNVVSSPQVASFYALSPTQSALLATRGVSGRATSAALEYLDSLSGTVSLHSYRVQPFVRFDAAVTRSDHVTLGYIGNRFDAPAGASLGGASDAVVARGTGSVGERRIGVDVGTARWQHGLSARASNEVRGQFAHDLEYETPHAPLPQEPAIGPGSYAPQVSIAPDGFAYGTPPSLGRVAYPDEYRLELADALELRLGRHLLRIGGAWSRINDRLDSLTNAEGSFSYDSALTGGHAGGLVDWITDYTFNVNAYPNGGCPSINAATHLFCFHSFTQSFGPVQTQFVTHEFGGYAEDSWRVRTSLVVTAGARYDYELLPFPQRPNLVLDAALAGLGDRIGGATASFPEDRNNVGPRLRSPGFRSGAASRCWRCRWGTERSMAALQDRKSPPL
jgi:hypothetical protein